MGTKNLPARRAKKQFRVAGFGSLPDKSFTSESGADAYRAKVKLEREKFLADPNKTDQERFVLAFVDRWMKDNHYR